MHFSFTVERTLILGKKYACVMVGNQKIWMTVDDDLTDIDIINKFATKLLHLLQFEVRLNET